MVRPSPILCARLRLTTKQVNGGYYKGNRSGSMGSHTEYGGYIIDWRKVRHFNVPDLSDFKLTPFVTNELHPPGRRRVRPNGSTFLPAKVDAMDFLQQWKQLNPAEYDHILQHQAQQEQTDDAADQSKGMDNNTEAAVASKEEPSK